MRVGVLAAAALAVLSCRAARAAAAGLPDAAAVRAAGIPETLFTVNKHKCQKNMDYLEFGNGAKDRMCDFVELAVQKAKLRVAYDPAARGLVANVTFMSECVEGFDGKVGIELKHEATPDEPWKHEDVSYCTHFLSRTMLYPTAARQKDAEGEEDGAFAGDGPPSLAALTEAGASLCVPYTPLLGHSHVPLPGRAGGWQALVYLTANSGSVLGRVRFKFTLPEEVVAWAQAAAAAEEL